MTDKGGHPYLISGEPGMLKLAVEFVDVLSHVEDDPFCFKISLMFCHVWQNFSQSSLLNIKMLDLFL